MLDRVSLVGQMVKNPLAKQETQVWYLGGEDPLKKGMATHSMFLPGEFHGQTSLVGCRPWGHKESDTAERLNIHTQILDNIMVHFSCVFFSLKSLFPFAFCLGNFYFILSFSSLLILPSTVSILLISQSIYFFSYQNFILNISWYCIFFSLMQFSSLHAYWTIFH